MLFLDFKDQCAKCILHFLFDLLAPGTYYLKFSVIFNVNQKL